jgi:hypothetical protein
LFDVDALIQNILVKYNSFNAIVVSTNLGLEEAASLRCGIILIIDACVLIEYE